MSQPTRYPLAWPQGWPRAKSRRNAQFKLHFEKAIKELEYEIERLGGKYPLLSSNVRLTLGGTPRLADRPSDTGVAVYFELGGKQKVFACDTYYEVKDNIRAICLTIESLRAIQRYGATAMLERTLHAFDALPVKHWAVLGIEPTKDENLINQAFREKTKRLHPDVAGTGDNAKMVELTEARADALRHARA